MQPRATRMTPATYAAIEACTLYWSGSVFHIDLTSHYDRWC